MKSIKKRRGARLGQHFLTGEWAAKALTEAVQVQPGETIVEIGPGKGALTKKLLATGARVIAIEKDEALARELHDTFNQEITSGSLIVIEGDVRDFLPTKFNLVAGKYVLAANIPYYITGEIIRQFLSTDAQPRSIALLIQKEVADRVVARNGKESILSLSVKVYGTPSIVAKVSKGNFSPPPSVDSAIILIDNISKKLFSDMSEPEFFKVVRAGFASKRKFLGNNLAVLFEKDAVALALSHCNIALNTRAEDVVLEKWIELTKALNC